MQIKLFSLLVLTLLLFSSCAQKEWVETVGRVEKANLLPTGEYEYEIAYRPTKASGEFKDQEVIVISDPQKSYAPTGVDVKIKYNKKDPLNIKVIGKAIRWKPKIDIY